MERQFNVHELKLLRCDTEVSETLTLRELKLSGAEDKTTRPTMADHPLPLNDLALLQKRKLLIIVRGQKIIEDNGKISVDGSDVNPSITALLRRPRFARSAAS